MSNIVRTWEDQALPAGEIELTDAQLAAVFGAWDDDDHHEECEEQCKHFHKKNEKKVEIHLEINFEKEVSKDKEFHKDCD